VPHDDKRLFASYGSGYIKPHQIKIGYEAQYFIPAPAEPIVSPVKNDEPVKKKQFKLPKEVDDVAQHKWPSYGEISKKHYLDQ
jgi:hypothetical protein